MDPESHPIPKSVLGDGKILKNLSPLGKLEDEEMKGAPQGGPPKVRDSVSKVQSQETAGSWKGGTLVFQPQGERKEEELEGLG